VNSATTIAPATSSEKVDRATRVTANPTGQRRRHHSATQPSAPTTWSTSNSHAGTGREPARWRASAVTTA
jgi:hypothetical protein